MVHNIDNEKIYQVSVSCVPEKGWVVVQAETAAELENPVVELSVLSSEGQTLAGTLMMDAPASFRVTLHPRPVEPSQSLLLRVRLVSTADASVSLIGEYPFTFTN